MGVGSSPCSHAQLPLTYSLLYENGLMDPSIPSPRQTFLSVFAKAVPLVFLAFSTIALNLMVLLMFKVKKSLRSCKNIYLGSLAVADLIIGVCMFVATVQQLKGTRDWLPRVWCKLYLILRQSALYVSLLSLVLITGDRWWSVHYPFSYRAKRRKRNAFLAVGFVWLFGFVLHTLPVVLFDDLEREMQMPGRNFSAFQDMLSRQYSSCEMPFAYSVYFVAIVSAVQYLIPLVAMLFLNCSLYVGILGRKRVQIRRSLTSSDRLMYERCTSVTSVADLSGEETFDFSNGSATATRSRQIRPSFSRRNSADVVLLRHSASVPLFPNFHNGNATNNTTTTVTSRLSNRRFSWAPQKSNSIRSKNGEERAKSLLVRQDRRAACWLGLLVIVFLVCWLPHSIVSILQSVWHTRVPSWANDVTFWFLMAHSAINPLLYGLFNKEIRDAFKQWMWGTRSQRISVKHALLYYSVGMNPVMPMVQRMSSFETVPE